MLPSSHVQLNSLAPARCPATDPRSRTACHASRAEPDRVRVAGHDPARDLLGVWDHRLAAEHAGEDARVLARAQAKVNVAAVGRGCRQRRKLTLDSFLPMEFTNIKLPRSFVTRLKIEAAKAGVPMYVFLERNFSKKKARIRRK